MPLPTVDGQQKDSVVAALQPGPAAQTPAQIPVSASSPVSAPAAAVGNALPPSEHTTPATVAASSSQEPGKESLELAKLLKEVETLRKSADVSSVDTAVSALQTLLAKPSELFDTYTAMAALENLVDTAREKADARANRFGIVLRQCRPLVTDGNLQNILIKLIASKEEAEVAKAIQKSRKEANALRGAISGRSRPPSPYHKRGGGRPRPPTRCWSCGQTGHYARGCPNRRF